MASGTRRTVRSMAAIWSAESGMLPFGPPRPWETMSSSGRLRSSSSVFGISHRPACGVGLDQALGVVTQRLADFEDGPKFITPRAGNTRALVHCPGNLVEITADRAQFTHGVLQGGELVLRQRRQPP